MTTVTLYMKAGCSLCDTARDLLEGAVADLGRDDITIAEEDIRRDDALFERYRYRIPVIALDGVERLEGIIEAADIEDLLARDVK